MQRKLIGALSGWRGRHVVEDRLEELGFHLHRLWQKRVLEFCGEDRDAVERYWDEFSLEKVRSGGAVNPDKRQGFVEGAYRSPYLDGLASAMDFAEAPFNFPPLVKCLFEYDKRKYYDREFSEKETEIVEKLKTQEMGNFNVSVAEWTGKKVDIAPILDKNATAKKFVLRRGRYRKESSCGVIFEIKADLGGNPLIGRSLPLTFFVHHKAEKDFVWEISRMDLLVPGFGWYAYGTTPERIAFGIMAHVEVFDILYDSIQ